MKTHKIPALDVRDLSISVRTENGLKPVVHDFSYSVHASETLCIAGETGSGKSITSLGVMGLLPKESAVITNGTALLGDEDLLHATQKKLDDLRGNTISMIFQEPMTSLNPVMTIGDQLREVLLFHKHAEGRLAKRQALAMLDAVRLSEAKKRFSQYPHELSGGMRQRVMIAMSLLCKPRVLIADEPTTALDVTIQAQILTLMKELQQEFHMALVLITHDMGVVAEMADRVLVVQHGKMMEQGSVEEIFYAPQREYTRKLIRDSPKLGSIKRDRLQPVSAPPRKQCSQAPASRSFASKQVLSSSQPLLSVKDLTVGFDIAGGLLRRPMKRVHAVEKVSFDLFEGETVALVGESGCGKSTIGRALLNLVDWQGQVSINGKDIRARYREDPLVARRHIQMIFQDPYASLNPRMNVGDLVSEPLDIHRIGSKAERREKVAYLFERVGLSRDHMKRYPHEFSGGQRQRICIARALTLNPKIIVADESVSALDVTVQARVLELMGELQQEMGLSYLFISHDLAVVEQISHRVAVMYLGQIIEIGSREEIFETPTHPYTKALIDAVPVPDPRQRKKHRQRNTDEIASPVYDIGTGPKPVVLEQRTKTHAHSPF
ncbi:Glutathione import ATP-binding protein GsiA [Pseudovibrio sp. Ad26]|nr:Glutathione import ATP-binding protein GsiA [Pseudovibrio sp. Ad26]